MIPSKTNDILSNERVVVGTLKKERDTNDRQSEKKKRNGNDRINSDHPSETVNIAA